MMDDLNHFFQTVHCIHNVSIKEEDEFTGL